MANFDGYVTSEFQLPRGVKKTRKNGPFKDLKKFRKEIERCFIATGEVRIYFAGDPEIGGEPMSFHGYDHPDVRYFPNGVPEDFDPGEGDSNGGFLQFFQCIADHLIPGAVFTIYYTGNEKLRPPLCGMSWWIHDNYITEVDICHEQGRRIICRRTKPNGPRRITK
jgi:hypothetical protein